MLPALLLTLAPLLPGPAIFPSVSVSQAQAGARAITLEDDHPWEPITDLAVWAERRGELRRRVLVAAGLWPLPPRPPLRATIHGAIDQGDHTVARVEFESLPGHRVSGNLYRPSRSTPGPHPAVLSPHGHWEDGRLCDLREELDPAERHPVQARCAQLARMGCVVFTYDMVGFGDSTEIPHGAGFRDPAALLAGQSAFGLQTWNSIRALDFLLGLPDVDASRVGVTGASGGGTQTFILGAIDDRPSVAFPAVMVSTGMQGGCVCENAPHLRVGTCNVELAALFAPRPLGLTGANDWTLDIERRGFPELQALYTAHGVPSHVRAWCWPEFEHNFNRTSREAMYGWFNHHLGLGWPDPVVEEGLRLLDPAELSVDAGTGPSSGPDPGPGRGIDAVRSWWSAVAEDQLRELARDPVAYREVVGGALEILVGGVGEPQVELELLPARGPGDPGSLVVVVDDGGEATAADVRSLRDAGSAVLRARPLLVGSTEVLPVDPRRHATYAGYTWGYNPTLFAHRVQGVVAALAAAREVEGVRSVGLLARGDAGGWSLLALGLPGTRAPDRAVIEALRDLDQVTGIEDPYLLPGALRYGGLDGFLPLCAPLDLRVIRPEELPEAVHASYGAAGVPWNVLALPRIEPSLLRWLAMP